MEPSFPLNSPPTCQCGHAARPQTVNSKNTHGHVGRPYFYCDDACHGGKSKFVSWNDSLGIVAGNPPCGCSFTSRIGINNETKEQWFHCPVGRCRFNEGLPAGYWACWSDTAAGPPGYATGAAQPKPGFGMDIGPYEAQIFRDGGERRGGCCGCLVM